MIIYVIANLALQQKRIGSIIKRNQTLLIVDSSN